MHWYGKLLGFIVGALLFRSNPVFGLLLGLVIGHGVDKGWFKRPDDDPYRVMGLSTEATNAEIELAYRRLMSRYHPDKLVQAAPELREQAEQKVRKINAAYDRIQRRCRR
ncbi:J domain-containing protein [Xylella taiwanensis]|uniref:DnaJ domain-containing protein n=1 Tax=Xylella taiwanensis TaxID=1444770 RepID=Z9JJB7_9GAMM|nr:DnaJ domain-containing protein [Xylella taiwanensis]AXI82638.1 membrane protein [Xylella taiwanensis]EWS78284.1 membrane protein [Xylella taiwanensis]MCD8455633.1 DnaJ domain-containing protein [Xylella taiwanensis]MCD8458040.1 DnaJ domain-containing protein [Xylella taiwanensis]MCD8460176.1 DnaJ domain-containing protein [Xylella taiwanensis]